MRPEKKVNLIAFFLGLANFSFTLFLLSQRLALQHVFLWMSCIAFLSGFVIGRQERGDITLRIVLLYAFFLLFLLFALNVWEFLFLPFASISMSILGLIYRRIKKNKLFKQLIPITGILIVSISYYLFIPSFFAFLEKIQYY